jgi:hypothetical protein
VRWRGILCCPDFPSTSLRLVPLPCKCRGGNGDGRGTVTVPLSFIAALAMQLTPAWPDVPPSAYARPLRAPLLAFYCTHPDEETLGERVRGYCAGYVGAVLDLDPELREMAAHCAPLPAEVIDEIVRRARAATAGDEAVLARDLIVDVVRDACEARG